MYKTGVYFGRFCPPHRGHLYQIIQASTKCETLVVVISDNKNETERICKEAGLPTITYQLRKQWIAQQVQDMDHIKVRVLDETNIPEYPLGWDQWAECIKKVVPEGIDAFFVGDTEYEATLRTYFPQSVIELFDPVRTRYPISATEIRRDILNNWHYILGPARPFFAKKVLIAGTESCGKTTLTKCLAKLYNTSWSEEVAAITPMIISPAMRPSTPMRTSGASLICRPSRIITPCVPPTRSAFLTPTPWPPIISANCTWATATSWWKPTLTLIATT